MDSRKRRRRRAKSEFYGVLRRKQSPEVYGVIISSLLSLLYFALVIWLSGQNAGELAHWLSGIGVLVWIATIIGFVYAFRNAKNEHCDTIYRVIPMVLSTAALLVWTVLYGMGIFVG